MSRLYEPCNLCFEREADIHLVLPMYEGKVVDSSQTADYAFVQVCQECFDKHSQRQRDMMAERSQQIEVEMFTSEQWQQISEWIKQSDDGVGLIAAERWRQISVEGWTPEYDDTYIGEELAFAAVCYAYPPRRPDWVMWEWPWDHRRWKPTPDDRVRELVKAGALIAAEIDRLKRVKAR